MGEHNCWYIVEVKPAADTEEEELAEVFEDIIHHVTSAVAESIEPGSIGAIATADETTDGYYLVQFSGLPFVEQDGSGALLCECYWLYPIPGARKWYTRSEVAHTVDLTKVVDAKVEMNSMSQGNMIPAGARRLLDGKIAEKISETSSYFIVDEILRRERLEYDPSGVCTGDLPESDSDSDSDVE